MLPRASCRKCERVTGRDEQLLLRGALYGSRLRLGLRTRNPRDKPKDLPLFNDAGRKISIPVSSYVYVLYLVTFTEPGVLIGKKTEVNGAWVARNEPDKPLDLPPGDWTLPALNVVALTRMLAKIAYSYAVAELGRHGFFDLISHRIVDPNDEIRDLVGGFQIKETSSEILHQVYIAPRSAEHNYIVVAVRLFAFLNSPTYQIVVGSYLD